MKKTTKLFDRVRRNLNPGDCISRNLVGLDISDSTLYRWSREGLINKRGLYVLTLRGASI